MKPRKKMALCKVDTQRGQALVPVLFIVLILTAVAATLSSQGRQEIKAAANSGADYQAYCIEQGVVRYVANQIQQLSANGITSAALPAPANQDSNGWAPMGDGWYKVDVIDTASRLNINTADVTQLVKLPVLSDNPDIACAIVDWRDSDENPTETVGGTGAESDYYQSLNPPYSAKNAPFDTVDELLLVKGITSDLFYGAAGSNSSANSVTGISSDLSSTITSGDTSNSLSELVTTYSLEQNVASDGTARVNVKTASQSDLQTKLNIPANVARRIVSDRGSNGANLKTIADLMNTNGVNRTLMNQIGDKITISSKASNPGLVNINNASEAVLRTIPNIDDIAIKAIMDARTAGTAFTGLNDVFAVTALDRQHLQRLIPYICTKSSIYLVRVRVRMPGIDRVYAAQALVEITASSETTTSGSPTTSLTGNTVQPAPVILQFREVQRNPGWSTWVSPTQQSTTPAAPSTVGITR